MYRKLEDVLTAYEQFSRENPDSPLAILVSSKDDQDLQEIFQIGVGESYIECVRAVSLLGYSAGYFNFGEDYHGSLPEYLTKKNVTSRNPLIPSNFLQVASFEGDPIVVAKSIEGTDQAIYWLDYVHDPNAVPKKLARNFLEFLILAANIDLANIVGDGISNHRESFFSELSEYLNEDTSENWAQIISMS